MAEAKQNDSRQGSLEEGNRDVPHERANANEQPGGLRDIVQDQREFRYRELVLQLGLYFALVVLVIIFSSATPYFFTPRNLQNILLQVSVIGMTAVAQTFVIISGGIDLSVGSMIGLTGVATGFVALNPHSGAILPFCAAVAVGGLMGTVNGFLISYFKIPPFIVTLASFSAIRGLALIATGTQNLYGFNKDFKFVGAGNLGGIPIIVLIFLSLSVVAYLLQQHTKFARHVYAIGGDRKAAAFFGVSIRRVEVVLYAISGAVAGLSGAALTARVVSAEPNSGMGFELTAIAAVIIGGTSLSGGEGGVERTFVGVLILGVISNGLNLLAVPSYYQQVISAFIIVLAVIVDQWAKKRTDEQGV
jgi:ribose/xylose/arabinose/galactoside ABC-type transport system permease subunit